MNFTQLRAFHAVAVTGTFSGAAQTLGVSQPAITQHIKSLEESLEARLFIRNGTTIELTANAMDLLPKVRDVMLTIDDIDARVKNARSLRSGHLTIGVCSPCVVMPVLERFFRLLPGVHVDVRLENSYRLLDLVASSRVDAAMVTLTEPDPHFTCRYLMDQRVLLLVNEQHPWWERTSLSIGELAGQRFILREESSMTRQLFERAVASKPEVLASHFILSSREAVKEAAAAGLGVGITLSRELGFDRRLRGIPLEGVEFSAGEYVVALPKFAEKGAIREFMDMAVEVLAH